MTTGLEGELTGEHAMGESEAGLAAVLILGRDTCEDTTRSRRYLDLQGIPYTYRNVELDAAADARNRSYNGGELVTPVILIGDPEHPSSVLIEPSNEALDAAIRAG